MVVMKIWCVDIEQRQMYLAWAESSYTMPGWNSLSYQLCNWFSLWRLGHELLDYLPLFMFLYISEILHVIFPLFYWLFLN